jgi:predicted metal-dependent hydrolase
VNLALRTIFSHQYRKLRPRAPIPEIHVRFYHFTGINNTIRLRQGVIFVRLSDLLEGAPQPVTDAIAHILLAKLYRKPIESAHATRYRRYVGSRDIANKAHLVRQIRGRKRITATKGRVYDLEKIFDDLNARFFHGLLARPLMTWSAHRSRQSLGHYDPAHNTIVISRIFDNVQVPGYAVEYLVYHEMLHLKYPVKLRGSRRCVHSREFIAEEKLYPEFDKAQQFLKRL